MNSIHEAFGHMRLGEINSQLVDLLDSLCLRREALYREQSQMDSLSCFIRGIICVFNLVKSRLIQINLNPFKFSLVKRLLDNDLDVN